jgi:hypothetical protein
MDECLMLTLINNLRRSMSRRKLLLNTALRTAIQYHTQDMYNKRYFGHVNKQGKGVGYRVKQQEFRFLTVGENIYRGTGNTNVVFKVWVNSPSHFKNLIDPEYELMGLGKTGPYWGQEFGTGRGGVTYDPCRRSQRTSLPSRSKYPTRYARNQRQRQYPKSSQRSRRPVYL